MAAGLYGFLTKTYLQLSKFFFHETQPPELLWSNLMTKLLLDMVDYFAIMSVLHFSTQWKSLSHTRLDRK